MFYDNALIGASGGSVLDATVLYTANAVTTTSTTTFTFSSLAIGTAGSNRVIVVTIHSQGGSDTDKPTNVTVGGTGLSEIVSNEGSDSNFAVIWAGAVSTGTTGNVVVTWPASRDRCGVGVWAVYDSDTSAHDTLVSSAVPGTGTIDCPDGGVIIGGYTISSSASRTFTWAGIDENYEHTMQWALTATGASKAFETAQTGLTVTCTPSGSASHKSMAVASFGPADRP